MLEFFWKQAASEYAIQTNQEKDFFCPTPVPTFTYHTPYIIMYRVFTSKSSNNPRVSFNVAEHQIQSFCLRMIGIILKDQNMTANEEQRKAN
jgi:hypothetical protein